MPGAAEAARKRAREGRGQRHHAGRLVRLDPAQHRLRLQRHPRPFHAMRLRRPSTIRAAMVG